MGKIEVSLKSEIQRLAKREIRATFVPLRREVRAMRLRLSSLSKNFSTLNRLAKYNGPQNLDRVICYTWERKGGGPSGEFEEAASAVV